jgi:mono/diheme cytochrome c family protein
MRLARYIVGLAVSVLLTAGSGAVRAADVEKGGAIAARWCAQCHAATPDQRRSDADPPTFAQIGRMPTMDAAALAAFLMTPHRRMPDMSLTRREIEDLVAFIKSQAR